MAIRQLNSEPIEHGGFFGCRLLVSGNVNHSFFCVWTPDCEESEWELGSAEEIDDLIELLKELREVDEEDCK